MIYELYFILIFIFISIFILTRTAADLGCRRIVIQSDPHAEAFYLRMGAERIGTIASSSIAGRTLPLLSYDMER